MINLILLGCHLIVSVVWKINLKFNLPVLLGEICAMVVLLGNRLSAQIPGAMKSWVDAFAKSFVDSGTVVGIAIGIIKEDQPEFFGYGVVDNDTDDQSQVKPDADMVYEIGSILKVF